MMTEKIDQKIKNILHKLGIAHKQSEKFYATDVLDPNTEKKTKDIYEMALAFDSEKRLLLDLELAYSEKYTEHYPESEVSLLRAERDKLTRRIRAWQNRQFPSQYHE